MEDLVNYLCKSTLKTVVIINLLYVFFFANISCIIGIKRNTRLHNLLPHKVFIPLLPNAFSVSQRRGRIANASGKKMCSTLNVILELAGTGTS